MTVETGIRGGYPPEVLGVPIDAAAQAADVASDMAEGFGRYVPDGWRVRRAASGITNAAVTMGRAAPYVEVLGGFEDPAAQLGADYAEIRTAVEQDLLAQHPGMDYDEAARSVTPRQVARSVGSVLGHRLFAPTTEPDALQVPLLRGLAGVYARQQLGPKATEADAIRGRIPSAMALRAAAPEILLALGFEPDHPMVASANQGGFVRGAAKFFAGGTMHAITRTPELVSQVQAAMPHSGEQIRQNFAFVRYVLGAIASPQLVQKTR